MPISEASAAEGAVVIVPFPYSDRLSEKRRPAVVVSGPELAAAGLLWIVMVTTARAGVQPSDVRIENIVGAGLPAYCVVRPSKIACIEPSRIVRRAGALDPTVAELVFDRVRAFVAARPSRELE